jgi:hypothetical protein
MEENSVDSNSLSVIKDGNFFLQKFDVVYHETNKSTLFGDWSTVQF